MFFLSFPLRGNGYLIFCVLINNSITEDVNDGIGRLKPHKKVSFSVKRRKVNINPYFT